MADLSKIKLNGTTYNFKDNWARANLQTASQVNTAINNALGNISGFSVEVVESLPATGEQGVFYLISNSGSGNNVYDEYVYVNNTFEKIGTTEVNLSNYLQKTEIADWAKAANKPTYTAAEVGALPSDTAIPSKVSDLNNDTGFITSAALPTKVSDLDNDAGYLTSFTETDPVFAASAAASISSTDITNWNGKTNNTGTVTSVRVQATAPVQSSVSTAQNTSLNTTISLASGYGDTQNPYASKTAKYVLAAPNAQNGVPTFRALVASDLPSIGNITNRGDITANAAITSGDRLVINDESASKVINSSITFGTNTKQYLANNGTWQNAYDDSALAARVQALEELEWATYYSGRSNPSNTQGKNGDIYLQY